MTQQYTKENPFNAKIKERYSLCHPNSNKKTQHIVLDLTGSGITYAVGDSIGIWPQHDGFLISQILEALGSKAEEIIQDKKTGASWNLRDYLTSKVNLNDISRKMITVIHERQTNTEKKEHLNYLLKDENHSLLKEHLATMDILDLLQMHHEVKFLPQELVNLLMPMMPRFYSIASSQNVVGEEVHLTVALRQSEDGKRQKGGICTHFLCNFAPLNDSCIPVYLQPHKGFTLPADPTASIIMVGPGTGIAPYRAFMQERECSKSPGKNWLFFGEWNRNSHFFYENYWKMLETQGMLKLDVAFSRDQESKIYVQHRMKEQGGDLFEWLQNGAYLYVCGDANHMAKDVDAALHEIVQHHGNFQVDEAKLYIKKLKADKRYLRDVY